MSSDNNSSFFSWLLDLITPSPDAGGAIRTSIYIPNNADISTPEAQKSLRDCVNTNVIRNAQATCKSVTNIMGVSGGKDIKGSFAVETGIFYSETCRADGTKEIVRGKYVAGETFIGGSKKMSLKPDLSDVTVTVGTFNGGWRGALNGDYTNTGGTFSNKYLSGGFSVIDTSDNKIKGLTVDFSIGGDKDIGAFHRGGRGYTYEEEVYRNGTWIPLSEAYPAIKNPKDRLPDTTPKYYDDNNYKEK